MLVVEALSAAGQSGLQSYMADAIANPTGNSTDIPPLRPSMPYSEALTRRVRDAFGKRRELTEKKMFGGVGFLLHGNMCVGVWQNSLIARVGLECYDEALGEPHVVEFDITGRPMKGWVMVEPDGLENDEQLASWIERSVAFVKTLPKK